MLCVEIAKGNMTALEVVRAAGEMEIAEDHEESVWEQVRKEYDDAEIAEAIAQILQGALVRYFKITKPDISNKRAKFYARLAFEGYFTKGEE